MVLGHTSACQACWQYTGHPDSSARCFVLQWKKTTPFALSLKFQIKRITQFDYALVYPSACQACRQYTSHPDSLARCFMLQRKKTTPFALSLEFQIKRITKGEHGFGSHKCLPGLLAIYGPS